MKYVTINILFFTAPVIVAVGVGDYLMHVYDIISLSLKVYRNIFKGAVEGIEKYSV